jgi:hypothetical protein
MIHDGDERTRKRFTRGWHVITNPEYMRWIVSSNSIVNRIILLHTKGRILILQESHQINGKMAARLFRNKTPMMVRCCWTNHKFLFSTQLSMIFPRQKLINQSTTAIKSAVYH